MPWRIAWLSVAGVVLALLLSACSTASTTTTTTAAPASTTTSITTTSTTTTLNLDVPVENGYEAFCTGYVAALDLVLSESLGVTDFGGGLLEGAVRGETEEMIWRNCMETTPSMNEALLREAGREEDDIPLERWYVTGCTTAVHIARGMEEGQALEPDELVMAACSDRFVTAAATGDGWEILRSGVCYYDNFESTESRVESDMVRCP